MPPLVTIGLPVFNAKPFLEDALRSVFAQTFADWELLIVDDGSRDGSASVIRRLDDPHIRVSCDGHHRGLGARLNQIVAEARGKYVARMDADDLMHPDRIGRQIEFLEQNSGVDLVGCGVLSFDAEEDPVSARHLPETHGAITRSPMSGFLLAHATTIARTDWWRRRSYNESARACEDVEFWLSSYRDSRFANVPALLYFYREAQSYSFRGYAAAKAELASVLWRQAANHGMSAMLASAAQWPRIAAYAFAHLGGLDKMLVRRRGAAVSDRDKAGFREALERIRATNLPLNPER